MRVAMAELHAAIQFFIRNGITGINITTPLKEKAIEFTNELTSEAETIGSVNTIKFFDGKVIGHNTDAIGFQQSLIHSGYSVNNKNAIIFGAGGAARAVAVGLIRAQCRSILIANRTFEKASRLASWLSDRFPNSAVAPIEWSAVFDNSLQHCQIMVNTTTVGMGHLSDQTVLPTAELLKNDMMVYDLIYRPFKTKLIRQAAEKNISWQNGVDMLICQGFESLKFWIDRERDLDRMLYEESKNLLRRELCRE